MQKTLEETNGRRIRRIIKILSPSFTKSVNIIFTNSSSDCYICLKYKDREPFVLVESKDSESENIQALYCPLCLCNLLIECDLIDGMQYQEIDNFYNRVLVENLEYYNKGHNLFQYIGNN